MQVYDRVIIIHIIPMFFPTGFSKELKRTCWSQGFDQKGECYKTKLFDLIKCSHGFNAIVTAMFMALMIFISAIRKMKLMYLWLRVTHSCNLPIYMGNLRSMKKIEFTIHFVSTKFCPNILVLFFLCALCGRGDTPTCLADSQLREEYRCIAATSSCWMPCLAPLLTTKYYPLPNLSCS